MTAATNISRPYPLGAAVVYGGVNFVSSLISLNLIGEYYIIINPVAIGAGLSIFKEKKILKLESSVAYKNGKVLNKYLPV